MFYHLLATAVLVPATLLAQIEIPPAFSQPPVRSTPLARAQSAAQAKDAPARPLWLSLAGKRVLNNRAHVVVRVADRARVPTGLRLLEPLGDGYYVAGLDLTSALGVDLLAGRHAAKALAAVIALEPEDKLDPSLLAAGPNFTRLPAWSADESNGETVRAEMMLSYHADVDVEDARAELRQLGVTILEDSPYFQHF